MLVVLMILLGGPMADMWVQLPNGNRLLLKVSLLTGTLRVLYEGKEMCKIGSKGGKATFNIGNDKVEIEYKTSMLFGTQKIVVWVNNEVIYENKLIMGM